MSDGEIAPSTHGTRGSGYTIRENIQKNSRCEIRGAREKKKLFLQKIEYILNTKPKTDNVAETNSLLTGKLWAGAWRGGTVREATPAS